MYVHAVRIAQSLASDPPVICLWPTSKAPKYEMFPAGMPLSPARTSTVPEKPALLPIRSEYEVLTPIPIFRFLPQSHLEAPHQQIWALRASSCIMALLTVKSMRCWLSDFCGRQFPHVFRGWIWAKFQVDVARTRGWVVQSGLPATLRTSDAGGYMNCRVFGNSVCLRGRNRADPSVAILMQRVVCMYIRR